MTASPMARDTRCEIEEHIEIGESHIATQRGRVARYLAEGADPAEVARLLQLMQDLLDGFRARRAGDAGPRSGAPRLN